MSTPDDDPDAPTLWAGRLRSGPPLPAGDPDAAHVPDAPAEAPDDRTVLGTRRRRGGAEASLLAEGDEAPDDRTEIAARRRRPGTEPVDDDQVDEGSTRVAHRETRRRASRPVDDDTVARVRPGPAEPVVTAGPAATRSARVPEGGARDIYRPRAAEPAIVERRAPAPREPQHPVPPPQRSGRRRRAWVVAAVALAVLVAAVVALVVLAVG